MKTIPAVEREGALHPAEPIPETAVRVICDGENYHVYEAGDELPPEDLQGETQ